MDERVRAQNVGLIIVSLAQGGPSCRPAATCCAPNRSTATGYNSATGFNKLDFTYQDNNWGRRPAAGGRRRAVDNWR
jgi:hypothetical protein